MLVWNHQTRALAAATIRLHVAAQSTVDARRLHGLRDAILGIHNHYDMIIQRNKLSMIVSDHSIEITLPFKRSRSMDNSPFPSAAPARNR
jgi:hypothetical protein